MGMSSFKYYLNNRFKECKLLARARDLHRDRDVCLYLIPNEFEVVGVSDGVDVWVAPVIADPFSVSIKRIIEDLRNGKEPSITPTLRRRPITEAAAPAPEPQRIERRPLGKPASSGDSGLVIRRRPIHS